jgi:predicted AAA+ superfamily ATPase
LDLVKVSFGPTDSSAQNILSDLLNWSGFPEPYFKKSKTFLQRWQRTRLDRLINQDLGSLENLRFLPLVEQLAHLLPEKVGSPLSINNLREDLEVHFATVKHWLDLLERSFYGFRVPAYHQKKSRLLKKEAKWYLWDWTELTAPGVRFENLVAVHLKKYVDFLNDVGLDDVSLYYLRDRDGHEIDFIICQKHKPLIAIECKLTPEIPSSSTAAFARKIGVKKVFWLIREECPEQINNTPGGEVHAMAAVTFLKKLV